MMTKEKQKNGRLKLKEERVYAHDFFAKVFLPQIVGAEHVHMMKETVVMIAGAGPSGISTSACLNLHSIPHIVLEREDTYCPLWTKKTYDRLHLHIAKHFSEFPHMPFPDSYPTYIPKNQFVQFLGEYVTRFKVNPVYNRFIESATYDKAAGKWLVKARNMETDEVEEYSSRFLVVATGVNSDPFIPEIKGIESFTGEVLHSTKYKTGATYANKSVLVVGCGNSGMEIAYDLLSFGAKTSIIIRNPVQVMTRWMLNLALFLSKYLPRVLIEKLLLLLSKLWYGDMSKYGLMRPQYPFSGKHEYRRRDAVIDIGTIGKIKSGEIQVLPEISSIRGGDEVIFTDGKSYNFDVILFATGFHRVTKNWLKDDDDLLDRDGMPKKIYPNHWKGKNDLYCAGLSKRGFFGVAMDAQNIASDIKKLL